MTTMSGRFATRFSIGGRMVGDGCPCFIIAEAGVAHFGSKEKAFRLVDLAAESRADAIKFQVFDVDALIAGESADWKERLGSRCLPQADFRDIQAYAEKRGIMFFATAHDEPSLDFLSRIDVPVYKIGSGELANWPFLANVAGRGKPVIFSTGMYTLDQVAEALDAMTDTGNREIAVLHCVTRYPTPPEDVNLRAMDTLRERFGAVTGYSDHTAGYQIPLAAAARGAQIIEKHITLDFDVPNAQDWKVSCGPDDLAEFVAAVRAIEAALGSGEKAPTSGEQESIAWARKSLVAAVALKAGEPITADRLVAKRPGTGIPPSQIGDVIGRVCARDLAADTVLRWQDLA